MIKNGDIIKFKREGSFYLYNPSRDLTWIVPDDMLLVLNIDKEQRYFGRGALLLKLGSNIMITVLTDYVLSCSQIVAD